MPQRIIPPILAVALALCSVPAFAQSPKAATYITDEEVKKVLVQPGVDHTIRVVDIGNENLAVGIIHRAPTGAPAAAAGGGAARGAAAGARGAGAPAAAAAPCGEQVSPPPTGAMPGGLTHDSQTEGYVIVSGGGTMITGGHIVNGRKSAADADLRPFTMWPASGETGRRDHHSGRRAARLDRHHGPRGLPQHPPVGSRSDGGLRASGDQVAKEAIIFRNDGRP